MLPFQGVGDAGEAGLHHDGGGDSVAGAHPQEVEGLLHVLQVPGPAPDAGYLLGRVGEGVPHPGLVQPGDGCGGGGAAHCRAGALGAAVVAPHQVRAQGQQEPATQVVTQHHGPQQLLAGAVLPLGHSQGCRQHRTAGMGLGNRLEIVGLVGVAEHPVHQRGVDRRGLQVGGQHRRFGDTALQPDILNRHLAGLEAAPGNAGRQGVEDTVLGRQDHLGGQGALTRLGHILGQYAGDAVGCHGCTTSSTATPRATNFGFAELARGLWIALVQVSPRSS